MFFRTDRVAFSMIGVNGNRDYTAFSAVGDDIVEARMLMGIHFRFVDVAGRSSGQRIGRWVYKYFLRSRDDAGDELAFVDEMDTFPDDRAHARHRRGAGRRRRRTAVGSVRSRKARVGRLTPNDFQLAPFD